MTVYILKIMLISKLLSSELSTLLSGRYIEIKMLPEYKSFLITWMMMNCIESGAFPYVTNFDSEDDVSLYLGSLYNNILIKE